MIEKFIEGTNEQYSIREDGVVISHYRIRYSSLRDEHFILRNKLEMTPNENYSVTIFKKQQNVKKLLFKYFGYVFCKQCNCKSNIYLNKSICRNCVRKNKNARHKEWIIENLEHYKKKRKEYAKNNPEVYSKISKKAEKKRRDSLVKNYVANSLNIRVRDLSNELYEHHKALILFKRKVSRELKINIEKLV
jgi:hypothetical protein